MAQTPSNSLPEFNPLAQSQTLFLPAPGILGLLVKMSPKPSRRPKKFENAAAALAWCERERINLVFWYPDEAARN